MSRALMGAVGAYNVTILYALPREPRIPSLTDVMPRQIPDYDFQLDGDDFRFTPAEGRVSVR